MVPWILMLSLFLAILCRIANGFDVNNNNSNLVRDPVATIQSVTLRTDGNIILLDLDNVTKYI